MRLSSIITAQQSGASDNESQISKFSIRGLGLFASTVLVGGLLVSLPAQAADRPDTFADLAEKLLPSVVNISTAQLVERAERDEDRPEVPDLGPNDPFQDFFRDFFDRNQRPEGPRRSTSLGSGFIIDESGYVVTNNHVIDKADEVTVILHDDTSLKAEIVGRDEKTDLALLKVEPTVPLTAVKWGDSDSTRVGDWVMAIGKPFGLGGTVTAGIVSARARDIQSGPYDDYLQTDASINRGNSGGPMFNLDGEVIGVNTAIFSVTGGSVGIGFAIPSTLANPVIAQLQNFGRTRRGWVGVRIQQVTDEIAESLGLDSARGALVASVTPDGPAAKGGIDAGDVILTFNDRDVDEMRRLPRIVAETSIETTVPVTVWRDSQEVELAVAVGELEEAEAAGLLDGRAQTDDEDVTAPSVDTLGMTLSEMTNDLRSEYDILEGATGVVVTDVIVGSAASEKGVRPGDLIVEVGRKAVSTAEDVAEQVKSAQESNRKNVLFLIDRQGELRFVAVGLEEG